MEEVYERFTCIKLLKNKDNIFFGVRSWFMYIIYTEGRMNALYL